MQLMPATARRTAKDLKVVYSSKLLNQPEANIHLGAAYLAEKIKEFGDLHLAVASYNAGERPVHRWLSERPGVPCREFFSRTARLEKWDVIDELVARHAGPLA